MGTAMKVPLLDLTLQYAELRAEIEPAVAALMASQQFILGPKVAEFECAMAGYCGTRYAVGVSSGTDALLIALMAEGIGPGDEVITSPYSFFATAGSIARLGARPVFVDIDPVTFNIAPALVEERIGLRTRALLPVHLYGQLADMEPLAEIARRRGLALVEDAAQAIGAEHGGRRAGAFGDYGCFSFFPSKNLGGFGDGGLVTTNDEARWKRVVRLRNHGMEPKYYHAEIGGNFRLDALQALVLGIKLRRLEDWHAARQRNADRYAALFEASGLLRRGLVRLPKRVTDRHVWNQYVVRVARRDELSAALKAAEIGHEIYYPVPLHLQQCFRNLGYREGDLPESERAARETLALPIFPELTEAQQAAVVDAIAAFYR